MSNKILVADMDNIEPAIPLVVNNCDDMINDVITTKRLLMFRCNGLHFLVPWEVLKECAMALEQRKQFEDAYNRLPPVTISVSQCIPIPSETAKILLGL